MARERTPPPHNEGAPKREREMRERDRELRDRELRDRELRQNRKRQKKKEYGADKKRRRG